MPDVTVVIACYDYGAFVGEAIASARALTGAEVQVIAVDDGSRDGSLAAMRAAGGAEVIAQANAGVSAARNAGLARAAAPFAIFLDADDRLHPEAFERHREAMAREGEPAMVFGAATLIDAEGREIGRGRLAPGAFDAADVAMGTTPTPSQCMYRTETVRRAGGYREELRLSEDVDLNLRVLEGAAGRRHGGTVADYRQHGAQSTKAPARLYRSHLKVLRARFGPGGAAPDPALLARAERHWARYYGQFIPQEIVRATLRGELGRAGRAVGAYAGGAPHTLRGTAGFWARRMRRG